MKTTKKNFKYYEKRVLYWIKELNLNDYDISVVHEYATKDGVLVRGFCQSDTGAMNGLIGLGSDWGSSDLNPINNKELDKVALHEVLELRLYKLIEMIATRFMDSANIEPEKHSVIQILIKNILKEKTPLKKVNKKVNKTTKKINKKVNKKSTKKTTKK